MRSKPAALVLLIALPVLAANWQLALPGYKYDFPRDHFNHPDYKTEWWYYTGNVHTADGHRFGFELTFFRQGVNVSPQDSGVWNPEQVYLAHLALSDIDGQRFYHRERLNRAGPGLAGISLPDGRYWNGNWMVQWTSPSNDTQVLEAVCDQFSLSLQLKPQKRPVIHGRNGVSQKGPDKGDSSHYISFSRIGAEGQLTFGATVYKVDGLAWMDHEFFTQAANQSLAGWDWFAIQLDNNEELMLYRLRQKSGAPDPFSSGSYIDVKGDTHFLANTDLELSPEQQWQSPASHARYPLVWHIRVARFNIDLTARTLLKQQELYSNDGVSPTYWEGAMQYIGQVHSQPVTGVGYLEMTGYDKAFQIGQ